MGFDLQNLKISSPKMAVRAATRHRRSHDLSKWPAAYSLKSVQICPWFHKNDKTMVFYGFRSTKPENFRSKITVTRRHAQPEDPTIISVFSRAVTRRRRPLTRFTRSTRQALTHAPSAMTSRMTSPPLTGLTDLETGPGPNRLQKKKKKKNALTK